MIFSINNQNPQMRLVRKVVDLLEGGGIIIYPTDTVYGLGCDLFNKKAIEKIYDIKRRDRKQPFSFVCSDLSDISKYAVVPNYAYKIMKHLLPGPYTFILGASRMVPKILLPRRQEVGIRIPDNLICLTLVKEFGRPIISTSVKSSTGEIMTDPEEMALEFKNSVDCVIDGGVVGNELSSVVSLAGESPQVIRAAKGDVSFF
ncbi:MAG: L-threonylcarbamoyladenylate synthase [Syntrophales bacterium]|nr:L-threonylcarbamoyladenylate synthase [Syntrophales bacterium]MCK9528277.1 L-threonylcarbamoyladenylate synthase [Syntrophales bacterium]MDX9922409.1 L-threonylcarbamoyladenylate synthase [Syntrophales bacterium]